MSKKNDYVYIVPYEECLVCGDEKGTKYHAEYPELIKAYLGVKAEDLV